MITKIMQYYCMKFTDWANKLADQSIELNDEKMQ